MECNSARDGPIPASGTGAAGHPPAVAGRCQATRVRYPGSSSSTSASVPDSITRQSPTGQPVFDPDLWMDRTEGTLRGTVGQQRPHSDVIDQTREATNELDAILDVELAHGANQG